MVNGKSLLTPLVNQSFKYNKKDLNSVIQQYMRAITFLVFLLIFNIGFTQNIELYNWGDDSYKGIHVDEFEKIISSTLYIYPEEQMGTVLYGHELPSGNEIADVPFPVEWKQNRLMSFVSDGRTYHSVDKIKGQPRVTINFNSKFGEPLDE